MNSQRGEPRALFITFYFIKRKKKAVDREHYSSEGVHFKFHVSKVHLYIYRVIFISLLLYSDLHCKLFKKNDSSFTAQTVVIMITVVKNKRRKKEKEKIRRLSKIRSQDTFFMSKNIITKPQRLSQNDYGKIYLYKTDVIITVNTSKVI